MSHVVEPQRSAEPAPAGAPANGSSHGKTGLPERVNGHAPELPRRSPLLRAVGWLLGLSLLGGTIYLTATRIVAQQAGKSKGPPPAKVIPVVTAEARSADLDLHLSGLGTVTAFNTV